MATDRTRRLIATGDAAREFSTAKRLRRRLQDEAIKLNRAVAAAQARLVEINEEEDVLSAAIDKAGGEIHDAYADTPPVRGDP
jgi:hypothetical protein